MSLYTPLSVLVPCYTSTPVVFTKQGAVHLIVRDRLSYGNAKGHGNAAKRRQERMELAFEAREDANHVEETE